MDIGTCSFYRDDPERYGEEKQRYQGAHLKQSIQPSVVSVRVRRMFRVDVIGPVREPCR